MNLNPLAAAFDLQLTDTELVHRAVRGDESAYRAIYERYGRYVGGVVYRIMGDDAELEDIVQESFTKAFKRIKKLEKPELLKYWLITVTVGQANNHLAKRSRRKRLATDAEATFLSAAASQAPRTISEIYEALDKLPDKIRVPWILHRVEGMTIIEVAEVVGVSIATAKRRIQEGDIQVRRVLHVDE